MSLLGYDRNMIVKRITKNSPGLKEVKALYNSSFPDMERIPWGRLVRSLSEERIMNVYYEDEQLIGMTYHFCFRDMVYFGYLAVHPSVRNQGYGTKILNTMHEINAGKRIVGDIEEVIPGCEDEEKRRRRRGFYLRNGYESCNVFCVFFGVDYEIISHGGQISGEEWTDLIRAHWGKAVHFMRIKS